MSYKSIKLIEAVKKLNEVISVLDETNDLAMDDVIRDLKKQVENINKLLQECTKEETRKGLIRNSLNNFNRSKSHHTFGHRSFGGGSFGGGGGRF